MKYQKPALSITQQIAHWEAKGLIIQDQTAAQTALRHPFTQFPFAIFYPFAIL